MLNLWKKKFNSKEFSLKLDEPETFVICQWQVRTGPSIWYFIYRWLLLIYFCTTWLLSILLISDSDPAWYQAKYPIYLTNWGYTLCTFQALLVAVMISASIISYKVKSYAIYEDKILKLYKVYWCANVIATSVAIGISVIYWSLIYDADSNSIEAMNIFVHGMNSVMMIFDFWLVSHPVRLAHFVYPVIFAILYAIFSWIYFLAGGTSREGTTYIYSILDWNNPLKSLLVCLGVGVFVILIHVTFFFMYKMKIAIHKKIARTTRVELTTMTETKTQGGYINEAVIAGDQV